MKKTCDRCKKRKPSHPLSGDEKRVCSQCFSEVIEKRMRDSARLLGLADASEIVIATDNSAAAAATKYVLERLFRHAGKKIRAVKETAGFSIPTPGSLHLLPLSIEEVTAEGISFFLENKKELEFPASIAMAATMEELETFCKLKKLNFRHRKPKISPLLEKLNRIYPQTYHSMLSSLQKIRLQLSSGAKSSKKPGSKT